MLAYCLASEFDTRTTMAFAKWSSPNPQKRHQPLIDLMIFYTHKSAVLSRGDSSQLSGGSSCIHVGITLQDTSHCQQFFRLVWSLKLRSPGGGFASSCSSQEDFSSRILDVSINSTYFHRHPEMRYLGQSLEMFGVSRCFVAE